MYLKSNEIQRKQNWIHDTSIVLVESNFWFRFRFFIHGLQQVKKLGEKAEAELKTTLDKYYRHKSLSDMTEKRCIENILKASTCPVIEK